MLREQLFDQGFWRSLAPSFHIADAHYLKRDEGAALGNACAATTRALDAEGYVQLPGVPLDADFAAMAEVARRLSAENLDAVFGFVYDEFWRPYFKLDALFRHVLGPYTLLPDCWIWNVDPKRGGAGWSAHRDRGRQALRPDGTPVSLTCWIALSEATPLNGCLYIVPKHLDPTYGTPHEGDWRFEPASIRALPAKPGDVLMWNQAVMHWGGKSAPHASESRVSMSFELQRLDVPSIESPLMAPWQIVPFEDRLKLIAEKILHYKHISSVGPGLQGLAQKILS